MSDYIVYYENNEHLFRVLNNSTQTLETVSNLPMDINKFYITKPYEATDEDLIRYCKDISIASQELKQSKIINFDYISGFKKRDGSFMYRSHTSNIETIFKMLTKPHLYEHDPIDYIESSWIEKTYNGGLMYCNPGIYDCYGYDFKMYYGSILSDKDFIIPTKQGKQIHINKLSDTNKFGFYMVKIICEDASIKKVFSFSENNVYTHNDLKFITDILIKKHNFNIKLELIEDVDYNAYVYEDESLTSGDKIFSNWFKTICELKKRLPKNILIKLLSSSLWGHLSKYNTVNKTMKQIKESNMKVGLTDKSDFIILNKVTKGNDVTYYKLLDNKNPYKYNIRLKPFITSYGRIKTALVALLDVDNIVRIHTDGLVFSKQQKFNIKDLILEDKTTGEIEFSNINCYTRL